MMRAGKVADEHRGVVLIEFVVVFPLLWFMIVGIWEMGRLIDANQIMANACREAGRQASTGKKTPAEIQQTVDVYLKQAGFKTTGLVVTVTNMTASARADPSEANQLDRFRVTASLPVANIRYLPFNVFGKSSTVQAMTEWYSMRDIPIMISTTIPSG